MEGALIGPYRLEHLLGRGGMGEVWQAYDTTHHRTVALKLLLDNLSTDPEYQARFEREARIAANLHEQHIIPIHRYGQINGQLFIDMRYVDGEDLSQLLRRTGPLEPRRAVGIIEQVAAALDAAHAAGLVHRDVKPANVLIATTRPGTTDSVYLADFGIARAGNTNSGLTATGAAVGTPDYMAPERLTSGTVDHRADIYALGCLLYEILTGRKPFPADEHIAVLYQHVQQPPPRATDQRPDLPPGIDDVITTSMAKDPADRHPTAGDLATSARSALDGLDAVPVGAVDSTATERTPPRRRLLVIAALTVVAIVATSTTAVIISRKPTAAAMSSDSAPIAAANPAAAPASALIRTLTGHTDGVTSVAVAVLEGRPVIVSAGRDKTIRRWDAATGAPIGQPITGHTGEVLAVAIGQLAGRPILVSASRDKTIRRWDLATGVAIGQPITGHTGEVFAVATAESAGRSVIVSGSGGIAADDYSIRRWDLDTGAPIGRPIISPDGGTYSGLATATIDGKPVIIAAGGLNKTVGRWDLATGQPIGQPIPERASTLATAQVDGRPVLVTGGFDKGTLKRWDLTTGQAIGQPVDLEGEPRAMTTTDLNGRPVVITHLGGAAASKIGLFDLATGQRIGSPLIGHSDVVWGLTTASLDGRTVLVSGSSDRTVRIWNLPTR